MAVAQGTHTGIVSGEFGGDAITAMALPTTSGSGIPAITDSVKCNIGNGFQNGFDPHTVTAYKSPSSGHAIALLANGDADQLAVVDLTDMLDLTRSCRKPATSAQRARSRRLVGEFYRCTVTKTRQWNLADGGRKLSSHFFLSSNFPSNSPEQAKS